MSWTEVQGWAGLGGTKLGTTRTLPSDLGIDKIATAFKKHEIHGVLFIGGFEVIAANVNFEV